MKKTIIILSIVFTLFAAGVLFGNHPQTDEREAASLEEAYKAQFPETMPDVVMNPMVGFPMF